MTPRLEVLIATPLEPELVDRVRAGVPDAVVHFDPVLLPEPRFPCDHRGADGFTRDAEGERRWTEWLGRADALFGIPGDSPEGLREVVRAHPQVRFVQGTAAGTGEVVRRAGLTADDLERVQVASSVGVHASQLAEWAIFGLLAFAKGLPRLLADQAAHRWGHYPVRELDGEHLVIVGLGQIGRQTARYARALGMRVTGVRRQHGNAPDPDVDELRSVDELGDIFPTCDAVVLALPNTAETAGLVTRDLLAALPTHAIVVNVGRGRTVDEEGLVDALRAGRLGGAALDVFATEPLPADSPLWDLPNVLISPHTAALSVRENERIVELFVENLQRYRRGESVRNRIDPRHFY